MSVVIVAGPSTRSLRLGLRAERIPETKWSRLKVQELQEQLAAKGLPKKGRKAELIQRLEKVCNRLVLCKSGR